MPLFVEWMRRKPGTSTEEFTAYWRDHHAPIVRDRPTIKAGLRAEKYTHYRTRTADPLRAEMAGARGFEVAGYDGICIPESQTVSIDDYAAALAEQDGTTLQAWLTLLDDEVNFMDMTTSIPCFATEDSVLSSPDIQASAHVMICYRAAAEVSTREFLDFKSTVFAKTVDDLGEHLGLIGYRQIVPIDTPLNAQFCAVRGCIDQPYDAMDVYSFATRADLERSWRTARPAWNELAQAERHMVVAPSSALVVTDSVVIFDDRSDGRLTGAP